MSRVVSRVVCIPLVMGGCRLLEKTTPGPGGCPGCWAEDVGACCDAMGDPGVEGVDCGTAMGVFKNGFRLAASLAGGFM